MSAAEQPPVSRGLLIALGAVVGVAVLVALWFFVVSPLLVDEPLAEPVPAGDVEEEDADEPVTAPEELLDPEFEDIPPPETDEVFSARDPFQQLVQASATSPAATGGDGGSGGGGDAGTGGSGGDGGGDAPAPAVRVGQTSVRLVEVVTGTDGVTRVLVEVNGESYEAAEDQQFAERFRVLDISGECATFLFGDNRFTLCKGESIRK
jgi:hypothetical protein